MSAPCAFEPLYCEVMVLKLIAVPCSAEHLATGKNKPKRQPVMDYSFAVINSVSGQIINAAGFAVTPRANYGYILPHDPEYRKCVCDPPPVAKDASPQPDLRANSVLPDQLPTCGTSRCLAIPGQVYGQKISVQRASFAVQTVMVYEPIDAAQARRSL